MGDDEGVESREEDGTLDVGYPVERECGVTITGVNKIHYESSAM